MAGTIYQETAAFDAIHDALRYEAYAQIVGEPDAGQAKQRYDALYDRYGSNSAVFSSLGKASDFWQHTFESLDLASVLQPDPEVSKALVRLSEVMPVSIFTNFKPQKIQSVLQILGIRRDIFTHILSGDDVSRRKPDLEGFKKMVEMSDLPPDQLIYVGDRVDVDIKPAKSVGMLTCLLWQSSNEANFSANNFRDVYNIIQNGHL